jgi:hypothetical protein
VAAEIIQIAKEDTKTNLADPLTKMMKAEERDEPFDRWMY